MSISAEDLKPFISNADSDAVLASIVSDIRSYVSRRRNKEFFEKEIYKWDLVRKWYGRDICSAEDLQEGRTLTHFSERKHQQPVCHCEQGVEGV